MKTIDEKIDKLSGAQVFSPIDLRNCFFHVPVDEDSRKYTTFVTHNGQCEFVLCHLDCVHRQQIFSVLLLMYFDRL